MDWKAQGSITRSGTYLGHGPETTMHFTGLETVRLHPQVQNILQTGPQDTDAFQ